MRKLIEVIIITLALAAFVSSCTTGRVRTNEALINHMHHRLNVQDSLLIMHNDVIVALLEDPIIEMIWLNSIRNPINQPFVLEVAFNLSIPIESVTQEQFNQRYLQ